MFTKQNKSLQARYVYKTKQYKTESLQTRYIDKTNKKLQTRYVYKTKYKTESLQTGYAYKTKKFTYKLCLQNKQMFTKQNFYKHVMFTKQKQNKKFTDKLCLQNKTTQHKKVYKHVIFIKQNKNYKQIMFTKQN